MLVVLVERHGPPHLLRRRVDLDRAPCQLIHRSQYLTCDLTHRSVGGEGGASRAPVAVLDDGLVGSQVERDHQHAGPVARREWEGLPATRAQT